MSREARPEPELVVDWIRCDGYGLCGDLAPQLVELDDWRYPILPNGPIPPGLLDDARRIIDCCPMRALSLWQPSAAARRTRADHHLYSRTGPT